MMNLENKQFPNPVYTLFVYQSLTTAATATTHRESVEEHEMNNGSIQII